MLDGTLSIRERVIEALVTQLKTIRPPTYYFDLHENVFDIWEAPPGIDDLRPYVLIWQEPELVGRDGPNDVNMGGRYHCILPVTLTFEDSYDGSGPGSTVRQALAQRFLADIQLCVGTVLNVTLPLATNTGTDSGTTAIVPVHIRETGNGLNLEGNTDVVGGQVEFELEYWRCVKNPNLH